MIDLRKVPAVGLWLLESCKLNREFLKVDKDCHARHFGWIERQIEKSRDILIISKNNNVACAWESLLIFMSVPLFICIIIKFAQFNN